MARNFTAETGTASQLLEVKTVQAMDTHELLADQTTEGTQ